MSPGNPALEPVLLSTAVIPEHELLRPIAAGAYGQVWLARNKLGALRAVKIVHRANFDHERPFEREFAGIKAFEPISRLHEGFVDLLQVGRDDAAGYFYYVMELADDLNGNGPTQGGNGTAQAMQDAYVPRMLASELKRRGRLSLEDCIQTGMCLAKALGHLHRQGFVHRDVKPSNIIFVGGVPKLADVGLVAGVGEARSFVGTEGFIAPEGPGTPQADLYSLGIVLYVLSTGKSHQDFPEPLSNLAAEPDHARWLEFNEILHKACQAEVRHRYQSADEMLEEFALLQRGQSVKRKRAARSRWAFARKLGIGALGLALLVPVLSWLTAQNGHTPNAKAAKSYELGRWHYNQLTPKDHLKALKYLTEAVEADPKFAAPYSELTGLYIWSMLPTITGDRYRLEKTKEIAAKVRAIGPDLAEEHTALSLCRFLERDWRGAEEEIVLALKLNPNLAIAHNFYSFYLTMLERPDEARKEGKRAEDIDPSASVRVSAIVSAWPFMAERRFDEAIKQLKKVLELDRNFSQGHNHIARCYEAQSNYVAAIEHWRTSDLLAGENPPEKINAAYSALRQAYDTLGEQGYFRKWIELSRADNSLPEEQKMFSERDIAGCHARLGEKEKALVELETHFDEPGVWHQIKFEPLYDTLHDEPRYKALIKRAGLKE